MVHAYAEIKMAKSSIERRRERQTKKWGSADKLGADILQNEWVGESNSGHGRPGKAEERAGAAAKRSQNPGTTADHPNSNDDG